ncbi:hypothetical protein D3C78_1514870 [compost metagenome]
MAGVSVPGDRMRNARQWHAYQRLQLVACLRAQRIGVAQRFATDGRDMAGCVAGPYAKVVKIIFQGRTNVVCVGNDVYAASKYSHPGVLLQRV